MHLNLYTWQFWLRKDYNLSLKFVVFMSKVNLKLHVCSQAMHTWAGISPSILHGLLQCLLPAMQYATCYQHTVTYLRWHHACTLLNPLAHGFKVECLQPYSTGLQATTPWEDHEEFTQWWAFSALKCQPRSHVQPLHMTTSCGCAGKFELIDQAYAELNGLGSLWECNALGDIHWSVNELHVHRKGRTGGYL